MVARKLVRMDWSQSTIAEALGVSQAMVSKYLTRPFPIESFPEAEDLAQEAAHLNSHGADRAAIVALVCKWCFTYKEKGNLCAHHPVDHCSVCMNLRSQEEVGERFNVLNDIDQAVNTLQEMDVESLSPQVRINIAQAVSEAENSMDIAAIPGRLIPLAKGVRTLAPPEFGVSRHLSSLLLASMKKNPGIRAVMNIRYDPSMDQSLKKIPGQTVYLDRTTHSTLEDPLASDVWNGQEFIVDSGDFGIEPCTYVFGQTAPQVVEKVMSTLKLNKGDEK